MKIEPKNPILIGIVACAVFVWLYFPDLLKPNSVLFSTDDNIGLNALLKSFMPQAFAGLWYDTILMGDAQFMPVSLTMLLLWLFPVDVFTNWIHAFYLISASIFLFLFLRANGLPWASSLIGALTAFWLSSNATLTYAGHFAKFGVLMFAAAYLWSVAKAVRTEEWSWSILAGGALGGMFLEQPDVALFFSCILGPYALFLLWPKRFTGISLWLRLLLPVAVVAGLLAIQPLWTGYRTAVRASASMTAKDPLDRWNYCTQWSWPPDECIDFIAPGYMGWRSGEPEGPYWGRMGRSAGWEQTKQGFPNFKLENQYMGAIPIVLALLAITAVFVGIRHRTGGESSPLCSLETENKRELLFWAIAAVITLLLAFGKFFPLYSLFYQLPVVSSIRNPNKFLQVFQLAVGILAAYGFDLTIKWVKQRNESLFKMRGGKLCITE